VKNFSQRGFSLIEILVALVILTLALNAFFFTFTSIVGNITTLEEKTAAGWVALNIIAKTELGLAEGGKNKHFSGTDESMLGGLWQWHAEITDTAFPAVSRITVTVSKQGESASQAVMTGYLRSVTQ